jgi:hypothetical protein
VQTCHTHNSCGSTSGCNSCDSGCGNFLGRLRERFHRGDSCCDGGCNTGCCGNTGTTVTPKNGEKIENPPKKMPMENPKDKKTTQEVRINSQPAPNVIQVTPTVPSVEITPVPAPRVEGDRRDPF